MTNNSPAFTPEAVLFDCDGTLLLTAELHFEAMAETVRRQGGRVTRDWYMALTGLGRHDTFLRLQAESGLPLDHSRLVSESIAMTVDLSHRARVNPTVASLAHALRGRVPIAVVTNSEYVIADAFLRSTALIDVFDAVLTVESAARPKPAPDLYMAAARRLGVDIARCLVLEDSAQGIEAAIAAGATCLDVRNPDWASAVEPYLSSLGVSGPGRADSPHGEGDRDATPVAANQCL